MATVKSVYARHSSDPSQVRRFGFGGAHLRRLLREFIQYYNAERPHTAIADAPAGRVPERKPSCGAKIIRLPRVTSRAGIFA